MNGPPVSGMTGYARVYLGPEPEGGGPHPGIRGIITADAIGVHAPAECEWLMTDDGTTVWESMALHTDMTTTVPWHRVYSIEWEADHDA